MYVLILPIYLLQDRKTTLALSGHAGFLTQRTEIRSAQMTMVVVFVFTICHITRNIFWILVYFRICLTDETVDYLGAFQNILMVFNSSINLIIYCIFDKEFWKLCCSLFHWRKYRKMPPQNHITQMSKMEQEERFL